MTIAAGEQTEVEVMVPESGRADFYCRFHESRGMQGAFHPAE